MKLYTLRVAMSLACFLIGYSVVGQPFTEENKFPEEENFFLGITMIGNPSLSFSTISDYRNGVSVNHTTLKVIALLGVVWSLDVRATDNLRYQTNQIPITAIGVQSTNLGTRPELFLSTTNQTLASGIANLLLNQNVTIRYRAVGGSNFLKPGGTYTTTLVFTYAGL